MGSGRFHHLRKHFLDFTYAFSRNETNGSKHSRKMVRKPPPRKHKEEPHLGAFWRANFGLFHTVIQGGSRSWSVFLVFRPQMWDLLVGTWSPWTDKWQEQLQGPWLLTSTAPTTHIVLVSYNQEDWLLGSYSAFSFRSIFTFSTLVEKLQIQVYK